MNSFEKKLNERIENGSLRSLFSFPELTDFYSNDYLGIAKESTEKTVRLSGSTGSRLISGNSKEAIDCEKFIQSHFQSESCLIYNSGYDANLGIFSSLPQKGDTILYDQYIHASVRDGIRLSFAKSYSFRHNDTEDLEKRLKNAEGTVFVAIEGLYSMDGDLSPVESILNLCEQYNALLIVDEAHSAGIYGENQKGMTFDSSLRKRIFIRLITFGKAFGTHGATVLCSEKVRTFLVNFSRSFIYTTALPPYQYDHIKECINKSLSEVKLNSLKEKIKFFRAKLKDFNFISDSCSPIQILLLSGNERVQRAASFLQENGFAVKAIMSPTVAEGQERLRICIHNFNSDEEIEKLAELIRKITV